MFGRRAVSLTAEDGQEVVSQLWDSSCYWAWFYRTASSFGSRNTDCLETDKSRIANFSQEIPQKQQSFKISFTLSVKAEFILSVSWSVSSSSVLSDG